MPEAEPKPLAYRLEVSGDLPGEEMVAMLADCYIRYRDQMDTALRARMDTVFVSALEDVQTLRRKIWKELGLIS